MLLQHNLFYTGITRGKKLVVLNRSENVSITTAKRIQGALECSWDDLMEK
jgi:hypothetical protein